jgi:hypothetical protein
VFFNTRGTSSRNVNKRALLAPSCLVLTILLLSVKNNRQQSKEEFNNVSKRDKIKEEVLPYL